MAAGKGSRISTISNGCPKSFLEINGKRIFDYQIEALKKAGITEIIVVVGFEADLFLNEYRQSSIKFIRNPFFDRMNVLGSLWFALNHLQDGFYFLHADVFFDPSIITDLVSDKRDCVLCIEAKKTVEEEMKVKLIDDRIFEINKEMNCNDAYGEFTGIAKIGPISATNICRAIKNRIETMCSHDSFFEVALQDVIDEKIIKLNYFEIGKRISIEIDFPEDYSRAVNVDMNF